MPRTKVIPWCVTLFVLLLLTAGTRPVDAQNPYQGQVQGSIFVQVPDDSGTLINLNIVDIKVDDLESDSGMPPRKEESGRSITSKE